LNYSPNLESQVEQEIFLDHKDGKKYFLVQISPIHNQRNVLIGHIIVFVDITERKFAEMELTRLARTDVLTGVTNRRYFFELAENEYQRFLRYQHALTIILFDIDHFKRVNDTYGHHAGDYVLKHFAGKSQSLLRTSDAFARYGGEEFIALLIETTQESALETAERIRQEIESLKIDFEGTRIPITTSIGVTFADPNIQLEKLIDMADKALYQSKQNGRNQVTVWRS
jgi:diguanylate cyclase (GGDEF)-like protein